MKGIRACFAKTDVPVGVFHTPGNDTNGIVGLVVVGTIQTHWLDNSVIEDIGEIFARDIL